jgi:hypothetical protein
MALGGLAAKAVAMAATGLAGAVAWDGMKRFAQGQVVHEAAVAVTSVGLRGARAAEVGAEKARLAASDIDFSGGPGQCGRAGAATERFAGPTPWNWSSGRHEHHAGGVWLASPPRTLE